MFEFIKMVVRALIPSDSSDPKIQLAWRWAVATGLMLGLLSLGGGLSWAQGWVPGFSGVATKQDVGEAKQDVQKKLDTFDARVSKIEQTTDSINLRLIKNDIQQALIDSCAAQYQGNQQALAKANGELFGTPASEGLLDQYQRLNNGRAYTVLPCSTILIAPKPGK